MIMCHFELIATRIWFKFSSITVLIEVLSTRRYGIQCCYYNLKVHGVFCVILLVISLVSVNTTSYVVVCKAVAVIFSCMTKMHVTQLVHIQVVSLRFPFLAQ